MKLLSPFLSNLYHNPEPEWATRRRSAAWFTYTFIYFVVGLVCLAIGNGLAVVMALCAGATAVYVGLHKCPPSDDSNLAARHQKVMAKMGVALLQKAELFEELEERKAVLAYAQKVVKKNRSTSVDCASSTISGDDRLSLTTSSAGGDIEISKASNYDPQSMECRLSALWGPALASLVLQTRTNALPAIVETSDSDSCSKGSMPVLEDASSLHSTKIIDLHAASNKAECVIPVAQLDSQAIFENSTSGMTVVRNHLRRQSNQVSIKTKKSRI
eukprot:GEMP01031918.1.p1 GENE.GEMP01031918.1~~GEMP01031918.1.p1  ORF type:complete len:272 (+),score=25.40 GEMP01031918.1:36-851(+)